MAASFGRHHYKEGSFGSSHFDGLVTLSSNAANILLNVELRLPPEISSGGLLIRSVEARQARLPVVQVYSSSGATFQPPSALYSGFHCTDARWIKQTWLLSTNTRMLSSSQSYSSLCSRKPILEAVLHHTWEMVLAADGDIPHLELSLVYLQSTSMISDEEQEYGQVPESSEVCGSCRHLSLGISLIFSCFVKH